MLSHIVGAVIHHTQQSLTTQSTVLRLPSWLPGMHLKRIAPLARKLSLETVEIPFAYTDSRLVGIVSLEMLCSRTLFRLQDRFLLAWLLTACFALMKPTVTQPSGEMT